MTGISVLVCKQMNINETRHREAGKEEIRSGLHEKAKLPLWKRIQIFENFKRNQPVSK